MEPAFGHIIPQADGGPRLQALLNGDVGWLMLLRGPGDAGFSSRNPDYAGSPSEMVEYRLDNGQVNHYPRAWAMPRATVDRALAHFAATGSPPDFIVWHNYSRDGRRSPRTRAGGRSGRVW